LFFDISGISFLDERKPIFLLYDTLIALPAIWQNKPIIKAAQALGPFRTSLNRILAKFILPRITWIYARGTGTLLNLKKLGLTNVDLAADVGFYEATPNGKELDSLGNLRKPIIGISVSSVVFGKCQKMGIDYVTVINEIIRYLVDNLRCSIIMIPHAIRSDDSMRNNDVPVIKKILENSKLENIYYYKDIEHPYELRRLISGCDFLLASRFHAMISSLSVGVPVIILGWSHKYREVLEMFDLPECFITFKDLNAQTVIGLFEKLFPKREILRNNICSKIDEVRKLSDVNFMKIPALLDSKAGW
jgi:polysaccharide pyruvyl transferase WcaK-like protein